MTSLDVGCGFPNPSERYRKRGHIGIDLERGFADVIADAHKLPFIDNAFQTVSIYSTLDHLSNPLAALKEAYRVCACKFIIQVGNCDFWKNWFNNPSPEHLFQWSAYTLSQLLYEAGFNVQKHRFLFVGSISKRKRDRLYLWLCRKLFQNESEYLERLLNNVLEIECDICTQTDIV